MYKFIHSHTFIHHIHTFKVYIYIYNQLIHAKIKRDIKC